MTYCYGIILSEYTFNASMESMILQVMVYAKVQCIDAKPLMPEHVYDEGNWKYVEICGRVKDLGCSDYFLQFVSDSFMSILVALGKWRWLIVVRTNETGIICVGWRWMWIWIIRTSERFSCYWLLEYSCMKSDDAHGW